MQLGHQAPGLVGVGLVEAVGRVGRRGRQFRRRLDHLGGVTEDAADVPGGIWTPGAAMQHKLIKRLVDHAGLTFTVES